MTLNLRGTDNESQYDNESHMDGQLGMHSRSLAFALSSV